MDGDKTEPATPKRREEARKKGQIAQSREISSALVLLGALSVLFFTGSHMFQGLSALMRSVFQDVATLSLEEHSLIFFVFQVLYHMLVILMPLMIVTVVAGIGSNLLQVGFLLTAKPLMPKFSMLNPVSGMKRLFSLRALAELAKSFLKITLVGAIAYVMLSNDIDQIPSLMHMDIADIVRFFARVSFRIALFTSLAMIALAALDYAFQRWQHEKSLRMTKQEVKDELKQREGDPTVKSRIRSVQLEMARRRMMASVPEADVVVTNPTSLAIALKYDPSDMMAPKAVAKGAGFIAERIKEIARKHRVPVIEHKPLARALFKSVEIGGMIPASLYQAVAEILAYVYRLKAGHKHHAME
ncbi:MAG: flagellar biosynthesis protein FlhB [Thermodesulfobacteriota bacterium]|nr:flagellar biosynthesis protein FlhB [Thermodesulfobacteriota bacterium]